MSNQPAQVPLLELARRTPRDLRAEWPIQWSDDGLHETGHAMAPIGRYLHELADEVESLRAQLAEAQRERDSAREDADRHESIIDHIDGAALDITGPWPPGTCYAEAALALPDAYRTLKAERAKLREFVAAFDAWHIDDVFPFSGPLFDAVLEKRAAVGD